MLRRFFGPDGMPQREQFGTPGRGVGSGFVYDNKGHILTNNHVVEDAEKIEVKFSDGVEVKAKRRGGRQAIGHRGHQGREHDVSAVAAR